MSETIGLLAGEQLRAHIESIERLEAEKKELCDAIRDQYAMAKATGFDVPAMRAIVRMRKRDRAELEEARTILDVYMNALGMLGDTPLGKAAIARDFANVTFSANHGHASNAAA